VALSLLSSSSGLLDGARFSRLKKRPIADGCAGSSAAAKSSWFGRKAKPADEPTPATKKPVETKEEDPYTAGRRAFQSTEEATDRRRLRRFFR
jgi:hypothetical protein